MLGVANEDGWIYSFSYDPSHPAPKDTLPQDFTAVGKIPVTTAVPLARMLRIVRTPFVLRLSWSQRFPQTSRMSIFESESDLFVCATYAKVSKDRVRTNAAHPSVARSQPIMACVDSNSPRRAAPRIPPCVATSRPRCEREPNTAVRCKRRGGLR
jgi:hypothetical protein